MKKYQYICQKLNIDFKKDLLILLSICLSLFVFAIIVSFLVSFIIGIIAFALIFIYICIHFQSLSVSYNQLIYSKEIAFNGFYRYVIALIKNKHILYSALQASLEYVDEVLYDDVNQLIIDIENDTSLEPFFKFSENFEDESIKQMIILLYKTQESDVIDDVLKNIDESIVSLQDSSIQKYIIKEEKKVEKFHMIPIVLSAFALVIIAMFIFKIIGDGTYV